MSFSDIKFFITNKTIFQPEMFIVKHKSDQISNTTTNITLYSSMELNLKRSLVDGNNSLTFFNSTTNHFLYSYQTSKNFSQLELTDIYNRTLQTTFQIEYYPNGLIPSNLTEYNNSQLDFSYSYSITNHTTLTLTLNSTLSDSAVVLLNSDRDSYSNQSKVIQTIHSFIFTNLSFTIYNVNMTVYTINKTLTKLSTIAINDTTKPIIQSYTIIPNITTIDANFTFSKVVKVNSTLTYANGSTITNIGTSFSSKMIKTFHVPVGEYTLSFALNDLFGNTNMYNFANIKTKLPNGSSLTVNTNTSVLTDDTKGINIKQIVMLNDTLQSFVNDSVRINLTINSIVLSSITVPFALMYEYILPSSQLIFYPTSPVTFSFTLVYTNLSYTLPMQFIHQTSNNKGAYTLNLQSYVSNVTIGQSITLHLISTDIFASSHVFVDVFITEMNYSEKFVLLNLSNGHLSNDFFVTIPFTTDQYLTFTATIYFENTYTIQKASVRLELTNYGVDTSYPILQAMTTQTRNSSVLLTLQISKPSNVELYYGLSKQVFSSQTINTLFQTDILVNLSTIMTQNSINYYYLIIQDSNGNKRIYNNNTIFFTIFIPKLDNIAPYNTTLIYISKDVANNGFVSFSANELVNVTIMCQYSNYLLGSFVCGVTSTFASSFQLPLSFPLTGTSYIITSVIMTDKAGNQTILLLNTAFQT